MSDSQRFYDILIVALLAWVVGSTGIVLGWCGLCSLTRRWDRRRNARNRAADRHRSLTYWRDANPELAAAAEQSWEDHPAHRADIAKTRTASTRARMTREAWLNSPVTANDFDLWADEKGSAS